MSATVKPKHFSFTETLRWIGEKKGVVSIAGKHELTVATPPEFRGHPGIWSPEDLFVAAADACLMTTYLAFAARQGLETVIYTSSGSGVVELVDGKLRFTSIILRPRITVASADIARARAILEEAEANCLVSASMDVPVVLEAEVTAVGRDAQVSPSAV